MHLFDVRTVLLMNFITVGLCTALLTVLWRQNRQRFAGIGLWAAGCGLATLSFLLLALRGTVPDWLSILVGNTLGLGQSLFLLEGLQRFFGVRIRHLPYLLHLAIHAGGLTWFSVVQPDLALRTGFFSLSLAVAAGEGLWLLARRLPPEQRRHARVVAVVLAITTVSGAVRALSVGLEFGTEQNFLRSGAPTVAVMVQYQVLLLVQFWGLTLAVNGRLTQQIAAEKARFEQAFEAFPYATLLTRIDDGLVIAVNNGFETMFGYSAEEARGHTTQALGMLTDPEDRRQAFEELRQVGRMLGRPVRLRRRSGEVFDGLFSSVQLQGETGPLALSCIEDVTARRRTEAELALYRQQLEALVEQRTAALSVAKEAAEDASRAKSAFLTTVSHELRTPLNAIIGMNELARRRASDTHQQAQLAAVAEASQHLLHVVSDILDTAQIQSDRLTLEAGPMTLRVLTDTLDTLVRPQAAAKGLAFTVDLPAALADLPLRGDLLRLRQMLLNLASNAVKFTERGQVAVRVRSDDPGADPLGLRVEVEDTGIGIAAEDRARLFQPFAQLDSSLRRSHGGTGLGLALTQRLARLMGGEIGVRSEPGVGSTFWFSLHLPRVQPVAPPPAAAPGDPLTRLASRHAGRRLLVAEDEPLNQMVALGLLEGSGLQVDLATDGAQAVTRAAATAYDLILMDLQMPGLGGLDATRAIRALPGRASVPIVAMTADTGPGERESCLAAGMDDHLPKPIEPDHLYERLLYWLDARPPAATATPVTPATPVSTARPAAD